MQLPPLNIKILKIIALRLYFDPKSSLRQKEKPGHMQYAVVRINSILEKQARKTRQNYY